MIIKEGITSIEPDFTQMMYAVVKSKVSVKSVPAKELPDTNQGIRRENQYMSATGASPRNVSTASPMAYWNASSVIQEQVE